MTITDTDLRGLLGEVAYREYQNSPDWAQPKLREWAEGLHSLSEDDFFWQCASAIHDSALAMSFRGNWEHDHCKASACYHEAERRHRASGHTSDCRGDTVYSRAHANVMRSQGYAPREPQDCTCGANG